MIRVVATGIPEHAQGARIALEFVAEFLLWANGTTPTPAAIQTRFGVSRATAYRYRLAYQSLLEKHGSLKFERTPQPASKIGRWLIKHL